MAVTFERILKKAMNSVGTSDYDDEMLRDFLRDKALQATSRNIKPQRIVNQKGARVAKTIVPGDMIFYNYDPKHKKTLPYYDTWPIVFPIELYDDGFLGVNLHYLPPVFRARLMDKLYDLITNDKYNESTRLRLSYDILKSASKFRYFKPCIKRYLSSHVRSRVIIIDPQSWDYAMLLPLARFQKARERKVWDDSLKRISGAK